MVQEVIYILFIVLLCHGNPLPPNNTDPDPPSEFCEDILIYQLEQQNLAGKGEIFQGDILLPLQATSRAHRRAALRFSAIKGGYWPNRTIPYKFDPQLGPEYIQSYMKAIWAWQNVTCIRFIPRTQEQDYIYLRGGSACYSYIGRHRGKQDVSIGPNCMMGGNAMHELGHVIGFGHEQSRPDRDQFVYINWNNIPRTHWHNFCKFRTDEIDSRGSTYDYGSIMHYSNRSFGEGGGITIVPSEQGAIIGQRVNISKQDALQANKMYNCPQPPASTPVPSSTTIVALPTSSISAIIATPTSSTTSIAPEPTPTPNTVIPPRDFLSSGNHISLLDIADSTKRFICKTSLKKCVITLCGSSCSAGDFVLLKDPRKEDHYIRAGDVVALRDAKGHHIKCTQQCQSASCHSTLFEGSNCAQFKYLLTSPDRTIGQRIQHGDRIILHNPSDHRNAIKCTKKYCNYQSVCDQISCSSSVTEFRVDKHT